MLDRERIIQFARERRAEGVGPPTILADISYIKTVLLHVSAGHGLPVSPDQVDLARIALKRLGLIGKALERDRRPKREEPDRLIAYFEASTRQKSPMARLVTFAVATAMRQSEICAERSVSAVGIEVKASTLVKPEDFRVLKCLRKATGKTFARRIVSHDGNHFPLDDSGLNERFRLFGP